MPLSGAKHGRNRLPQTDVEFIRKALRKASIQWSGRAECLRLARKKVLIRHTKDGKAVYKFYWQCNLCKKWGKNQKSFEVDHVTEIGPFTGDWNDYLARHFPPQSGLQCICVSCHLIKTNQWTNARLKWKRK